MGDQVGHHQAGYDGEHQHAAHGGTDPDGIEPSSRAARGTSRGVIGTPTRWPPRRPPGRAA
ncbi:MAG: hypothetical protein ACLQVK_20440 [Acidimicrobiales bacterium]